MNKNFLVGGEDFLWVTS